MWSSTSTLVKVRQVYLLTNLAIGMAIILGGSERFSLPSYAPLLYFMAGHAWIWGVWSILGVTLAACKSGILRMSGYWLLMSWHIIWFTCFSIAWIRYENAASTPVPVYVGFALMASIFLTAEVLGVREGGGNEP